MSGPLLTGRRSGASLATTPNPPLLILGADAVLTARPATPVQLAHACIAAGYRAVIPASWGDELIAARAIELLAGADGPRLQCSCPHVARRLAEHALTLAPMLLTFVAPPVATAQYLRAAYAPARLHITFAGGCPSGADESIDVWLSIPELLAQLQERGISVAAQPTEFDSVIPPDRRRHFSDPGGTPARSALRRAAHDLDLVEVHDDDFVAAVAQQLLSSQRSLIDVAPRLGCCCSGAVGGISVESARACVRELEPPRSSSPIVDHSIALPLAPTQPLITSAPEIQLTLPVTALENTESAPSAPATAIASAEPARRRSPPSLARPVLGTIPLRRTEAGRQLPRAYVARRRSSPRDFRVDPALTSGSGRQTYRLQRWVLWAAGAGIAIGLGLGWLIAAGR